MSNLFYFLCSINLDKLVSTNSNSFCVGCIPIIADSCPIFINPSPLEHVNKKSVSPSLSLNTSLKYYIYDLSCAKNSFTSDEVRTA